MALTTRQRWSVLSGALALTVSLAALVGKEETEEPVAPQETAPPKAPVDKPAGPTQSGRVGRIAPPQPGGGELAGESGQIEDIFAPQSWQAAAQTAQAAAPSAPAEPELPFTYFGRLIDGAQVTVYLATPDRNLAVKRGDVIDGTWRVESIGPATVVFRHLPEGKRQSLEIGRAK